MLTQNANYQNETCMYKVFKIVKETSGLVIIRMKTSRPIGHSVFILIITKPSVFNYHIMWYHDYI